MIEYYIINTYPTTYEETDLESGYDYKKRFNIGKEYYHHLGIL